MLHHEQALRGLDPRQQPEAEHKFTHPAPHRQRAAANAERVVIEVRIRPIRRDAKQSGPQGA